MVCFFATFSPVTGSFRHREMLGTKIRKIKKYIYILYIYIMVYAQYAACQHSVKNTITLERRMTLLIIHLYCAEIQGDENAN